MRIAIAILALFVATSAQAATTFVDDVGGFLAAADSQCNPGLAKFENFEGAAFAPWRWEDGNETSLISSQGIDWLSNVPGDPVTTSLASAQTGSYGFYSRMHGQAFPLPSIFDGLRIETTGTCAFAIWMRTTTVINRPAFILDGTFETGPLVEVTDFNWHFFGIVEPGGFYNLEMTEVLGDQGEPKRMFFDNSNIYLPEPKFSGGLALGVAALSTATRRRRQHENPR